MTPVKAPKSAADELAALQAQLADLNAKAEELKARAAQEAAQEAARDAMAAFVKAYEADPSTVDVEDLTTVLTVIPASIVKSAVTRAGLTKSSTSSTPRTSGGTRAPRLSLEDVTAKLPPKGSPWKVADLASAISREVGTTRNFIPKLLEAGKIKEAGDDGGTPRPAKLYTTA